MSQDSTAGVAAGEGGGKVGGREGRVGWESAKVRVGAGSGSAAGMGSRGVIEVRRSGQEREGEARADVARAGTPTPRARRGGGRVRGQEEGVSGGDGIEGVGAGEAGLRGGGVRSHGGEV